MNALYLSGHSVLHRAQPGLKLVALLIFTTILLLLASPAAVGVAGLLVWVGYRAAGFDARIALSQLWPLRWFVVAIALFQLFVDGWSGAVVLAGGLLVCVAAANLVTLTTKVLDLMETVVVALHPLRRVVDPQRVALLLALTVRSIPLMNGIITQAREARAARGQEREWGTLLSAVVIRALRHADHLAEALAARGVDD